MATIRPSFGHVLLPPKAHTAIAAASSHQLDFDSIDKHSRHPSFAPAA
jgi:hypothetical protein